MERELARIWEDLLEVSPIDADSDFFDLGGDSLALVSLFATIEARFGRHLTIDFLSGGLTIEVLARVLSSEQQPDRKSDPVISIQPQGELPPFFCVHGIGGDIVHLQRLAKHMGTRRPFYGIRHTPEAPLNESIPEMAERYATAMLVHQPAGPFYIGGHSFGAVVAYEIARQLADKGHQIGLLAILDQRKPGWRLTARAALPVLHKIMWRVPSRIRREIAEIPPRDRMPHISRTLRRWSALAVGRRPDAASMFDMRRSKKAQVELFDANLRALRSYRPGPFRGPITLFRAEEQLLSTLALDATLGWNQIARTEVRVRTVPGTHGSITTEPFVQQLAKTLCDELDKTLVRSASRPLWRRGTDTGE
jgi:thioesterase domain-containing protein/acyl carrier protein